MKTFGWILLALLVLVVIFQKQVLNFFNRNNTAPCPEGRACTAPDGRPGTVKNCVCVPITVEPPNVSAERTAPSTVQVPRRPGTACRPYIVHPNGSTYRLYAVSATVCFYKL